MHNLFKIRYIIFFKFKAKIFGVKNSQHREVKSKLTNLRSKNLLYHKTLTKHNCL